MKEKSITYCYIVDGDSAFTLVSRYHIECLRSKGFEVKEVDRSKLRYSILLPTGYVIIHPYMSLYFPMSDNEIKLQAIKLRSTLCDKIVGIDVADSDRISERAIWITELLLDILIVPSNFSRNSFVNSGFKGRIEVVPHGVSDIFLDTPFTIRNPELYILHRRFRDKKKLLYFCLRNDYRKGGDIVEKAVEQLRRERNDFVVIGKMGKHVKLKGFCDYVITDFLDEYDLKTLYDICDILLLPSRGGAFELNGLEALVRYRPVIYPMESCIVEYAYKVIPELAVKISNRPRVFPNNKVHIGCGHEVDLEDFIDKIHYALDNVEELKAKVKERFKDREKYRWKNIVEQIISIVEG